MENKTNVIKWKLCKAYFSAINVSMHDDITFEEICSISKISTNDAGKIISTNENYNLFFLKILIEKLDIQTLDQLKVDFADDNTSNIYEKILEGLTLRFENYLDYKKQFKILSKNLIYRTQNFFNLFANNCFFFSNLLDLAGVDNDNKQPIKIFALNIVFIRVLDIFLKQNDDNFDLIIRNLDKNLRDLEDLGFITGVIKN